jgi:DegV family protein with EDD domain
MQRVRIVTDTVAQLTEETIQKHWIKVVPAATIFCDGRTFVDGVNISTAEAYHLLAQDPTQFTTAAIPPDYFRKAFEELSSTVKEMLCITVSSKLSAVHNNAVMASEQMRERAPDLKIQVLDSMSAAGGEGLIALAAARAAAEGLDLDAVTAVANRARESVECMFVFDTLRDAYRTGRIPKVASRVGHILSVRPLCRVCRDGKVHFIGLTRSRGKGIKQIIETAREQVGDMPIYVMVMHTAALAEAEKLKARVEGEFNCRDVLVSEFSPVMGYATGPGALGIALCPEFDIAKQERSLL